MLLDNPTKEITGYQLAKSKGKLVPFYMSSYIMDAICLMNPFPLMR
jgi:hypothetical protein